MSKKVDSSLLQKQHFSKSSPYATRHLSNSSGISSIIDDAVDVAKDFKEGTQLNPSFLISYPWPSIYYLTHLI